MKKLKRLWQACEAPSGLIGVRAELARALREEMPHAEPLLCRLPHPSETYPCEQLGWDGCPRRIVTRPDGRILAACGNDPPACETLHLKPEDCALYELDVALLCRSLAQLLSFTASATELPGQPGLWNAGFVATDGANRTPVLLILPASRNDCGNAIDHLLATFESAFVVLVPTSRFIDATIEKSLQTRKARLVVLQDAVFAHNGKLHVPKDLPAMLGSAARKALLARLDAAPAKEQLPVAGKKRYRAPRSIGTEEAVQAVITYIKERRGSSTTAFAVRCGTSARTLNNFFRTHEIRRSVFEEMAKEIGVSVERLLRGDLPAKSQR